MNELSAYECLKYGQRLFRNEFGSCDVLSVINEIYQAGYTASAAENAGGKPPLCAACAGQAENKEAGYNPF